VKPADGPPEPDSDRIAFGSAISSSAPIPMAWRDNAVCLAESPDLFFPIGKGSVAVAQAERAKVVCRRCEVIDTCLSWAMKSGLEAGVCGGLSANERHHLSRNARAGS